jgi:hypothetical protein
MHYGEQTKVIKAESLEKEKARLIRKGNIVVRVDRHDSRNRHSADSGHETRLFIRYKKKGPPKSGRKQEALKRAPAGMYPRP